MPYEAQHYNIDVDALKGCAVLCLGVKRKRTAFGRRGVTGNFLVFVFIHFNWVLGYV